MINDRTRPAVRHYEPEIGEAFENLAGKSRALLSDREDVIARELLRQSLGRDRLTIELGLDVSTEPSPVAELFRTSDVVV